jgi:hypothetical protein
VPSTSSLQAAASTQEPNPKKARNTDPFAALRDRPGTSVQQHEPNVNEMSCQSELGNYKALIHVPWDSNNPLHFWKQHQMEFPIMEETARRVLYITASSAQSERDFSVVDTQLQTYGHFCHHIRLRPFRWSVRALGRICWIPLIEQKL